MNKNKTCYFIGKFQPPHIGHVVSIKKLKKIFTKVVVGVTDGQPNFISNHLQEEIFNAILLDDNVEIVKFNGAVDKNTIELDKLPKNCVVASGNQQVIDFFAEKEIETYFLNRSYDELYSGTKIRNSINLPLLHSENKFKLLPTASLRPIERIFKRHYQSLKDKIIADNIIKQPLIVDIHSKAILDGSHRYAFLVENNCELAPCLLVDYKRDDIFVGSHLGHRFDSSINTDLALTKLKILQAAEFGKLFPPRTTRHFFPFRKELNPTSLKLLKPKGVTNITHLLHSVSSSEEIAHNTMYLNEIMMEKKILYNYLLEQDEVCSYLIDQINSIQNY